MFSQLSKRRNLRRKNTTQLRHLESLERRDLMAGDLDLSFGGGTGFAVTGFGEPAWMEDMDVGSDGKIVALGTAALGVGGNNIAVARYHADGSLDQSFGGAGVPDGLAIFDFDQTHDAGRFVEVLPDGKILVIAGTEDVGDIGPNRTLLLRLNSNGTIDETFGVDGHVLTEFNYPIRDVVVEDGRILLVWANHMLAYDLNGNPDNTFDGDGHRTGEFVISGVLGKAGEVAYHDGQYYIGVGLINHADAVVRLHFNGQLDVTYGVGGSAALPGLQLGTTLAMQGDGSAVGASLYGNIFRVNPSGFLDNQFAVNGIVEAPIDANYREVLIQPYGAIVAVGTHDDSIVAMRLQSDGMPDPNFGNQGIIEYQFPVPTAAVAAASYSNGKVLLGGTHNGTEMLLMRLTGHGPVDLPDAPGEVVQPEGNKNPTAGRKPKGLKTAGSQTLDQGHRSRQLGSSNRAFGRRDTLVDNPAPTPFVVAPGDDVGDPDDSFGGGDGWVSTDFGVPTFLTQVVTQSDGKIVAVGRSGFGGGMSNIALARYHSDGTLDLSFGGVGSPDGTTVTDFGNDNENVKSVAVLPDGKILVLATSEFHGDVELPFLARYSQDGILDQAFGNSGLLMLDVGGARVIHVAESKILVVGADELVRLNLDGSADTSFSIDGRRSSYFNIDGNVMRAGQVVYHDGQYLLGLFASWGQSTIDAAVVRLTTGGEPDVSYGQNGYAQVSDFYGRIADLQHSGGGAVVGVDAEGQVFRVDAHGEVDVPFAINSLYSASGLSLQNSPNDYHVVIQPGGHIVVTGKRNGTGVAFRLLADGTLDARYGVGGATEYNADFKDAFGYANGKVLLAGNSTSEDFFMMRLNGDAHEPALPEVVDELGWPVNHGSPTAGHNVKGFKSSDGASRNRSILNQREDVPLGTTSAAADFQVRMDTAPAAPEFNQDKGRLVVPGTGGNDNIRVLQDRNLTTIEYPEFDNVVYEYQNVRSISIDGGRGDDVIEYVVDTTGSDFDRNSKIAIQGGTGDDTIMVDQSGVLDARDQFLVDIRGGSGDDNIEVNVEDATINGDAQYRIAGDERNQGSRRRRLRETNADDQIQVNIRDSAILGSMDVSVHGGRGNDSIGVSTKRLRLDTAEPDPDTSRERSSRRLRRQTNLDLHLDGGIGANNVDTALQLDPDSVGRVHLYRDGGGSSDIPDCIIWDIDGAESGLDEIVLDIANATR